MEPQETEPMTDVAHYVAMSFDHLKPFRENIDGDMVESEVYKERVEEIKAILAHALPYMKTNGYIAEVTQKKSLTDEESFVQSSGLTDEVVKLRAKEMATYEGEEGRRYYKNGWSADGEKRYAQGMIDARDHYGIGAPAAQSKVLTDDEIEHIGIEIDTELASADWPMASRLAEVENFKRYAKRLRPYLAPTSNKCAGQDQCAREKARRVGFSMPVECTCIYPAAEITMEEMMEVFSSLYHSENERNIFRARLNTVLNAKRSQ